MSRKLSRVDLCDLKEKVAKTIKTPSFRKYLISGFTAFFVDFIVFRTMYINMNIDLKVSTACGIIAGFITSFLLQKFWSFKGSQAKKAHHQVLIYATLTIVNTLFTELVIKEFEALGIKHGAELGKVAATGFIVIWNFIIFKLIVFRKKES